MKIGIDARLWNETGVGRYIRALVSHLGQIDSVHEYTLFLQKKEFHTLALPNGRWRKQLADVHWHTLKEQIRMPGIYTAANIDVVHIPYFAVPVHTPQPFIVTIHDLTISRFATGRATTKPYAVYLTKRLGYNFVLKKAISRAAKIITVSKTVAEQIKKEYPDAKNKIVVTYESGELEVGEKIKPVQDKPYLLYVGNAHPHKNLDTLVDAFHLVQQKLPATRLVLVGRLDFFYERLKRRVEQSLFAQSVILTGEISNERLIQWYKGARAFVFPSQAEGFGIPGLEAMRFGCPVVCSDIAVFREIYGKAALFFDQNDPRDMADEIVSLLTKASLRNTLVKLGKEQANKFSWAKMARKTKAVYESCAGLRSHQ